MKSSYFLFVAVCFLIVIVHGAEEKKLSKKDRIRNAILRRTGLLQQQQQQTGSKNQIAARQEHLQDQFPDYAYDHESNSIQFTEKDDPQERVGIIAGKKILKIIGFTLLGLLFIPIVIGIPLLPVAFIFLILYNLPIVKLIDIPNNENMQRSLMDLIDDDTCIERISCQIGKRSGNYGKALVYWIQKRFKTNPFVKRISRGFEQIEDCSTYICSNNLLKRIL